MRTNQRSEKKIKICLYADIQKGNLAHTRDSINNCGMNMKKTIATNKNSPYIS